MYCNSPWPAGALWVDALGHWEEEPFDAVARSIKMDVEDKSKVSRFALWGLHYQNRV